VTDTATPGPPEAGESDAPRSARELVLGELLDADGALTVQQIVDATKVDRNSVDQALHRLVEAGDALRVERGLYVKAPPKPKAPEPPRVLASDGRPVEDWLKDLWGWYANPASWDVEKLGPPPRDPKRRVPALVMAAFHRQLAERVVAAEQAQAEKAAQAAEKAEAAPPKAAATADDVELFRKLLTAANGNVAPHDVIKDLRPIRAMLASGVDLDDVLHTLSGNVDRRSFPKNPTLASWREEWFLRAVAELHAKHLVPALVEKWSKAAPGEPLQRARPSAAVFAPPAPETAPAASPAPGKVPSGDDLAATRETIAARFAQNRSEPEPPDHAEPDQGQFDWAALVEAYKAGVLEWGEAALGPPPGSVGCKAPIVVLREHGYA
jgi:hypothetical protein